MLIAENTAGDATYVAHPGPTGRGTVVLVKFFGQLPDTTDIIMKEEFPISEAYDLARAIKTAADAAREDVTADALGSVSTGTASKLNVQKQTQPEGA